MRDLRSKMVRISRVGWKRRKIGLKVEKLVEEVFQELKGEGKILGFEKRDRPGSDFAVHFLDGKTLEIEVKSSFYGQLCHQIKYSTPVIVVPLEEKSLSRSKKRKLIDRIKRNIVKIGKNEIE